MFVNLVNTHVGKRIDEIFVNEHEGHVFVSRTNQLYKYVIKNPPAKNGDNLAVSLDFYRYLTAGRYTEFNNNSNILFSTVAFSLNPTLFSEKNEFLTGEEVYWVYTPLKSYESVIAYKVDAPANSINSIRVHDEKAKIVGSNPDGTYYLDGGFTHPFLIHGALLCRPLEIIPFLV